MWRTNFHSLMKITSDSNHTWEENRKWEKGEEQYLFFVLELRTVNEILPSETTEYNIFIRDQIFIRYNHREFQLRGKMTNISTIDRLLWLISRRAFICDFKLAAGFRWINASGGGGGGDWTVLDRICKSSFAATKRNQSIRFTPKPVPLFMILH